MRWVIGFKPRASEEFEVEAETEDEAVALAWTELTKDLPPAEWDVEYVSEVEEDEPCG